MRWIAALVLLAPLAAGAAPVDFAGSYAWESEGDGEAVWSITSTADRLQMQRHGDALTLGAKLLDAAQVARLWDRLHWPADTVRDVQCIGWAGEPGTFSQRFVDDITGVICKVPASARSRIDWIADHKSDWIAYDTGFGVIELARLP